MELARTYNLRLRESLGGPQKAGSASAVTLGVSAAAAPEGGPLVLRGRC
jgi:hypothetical protein